MLADFNTNLYYHTFIEEINKEYDELIKKIEPLRVQKEELITYLIDHQEILKDKYKIDLEDSPIEWTRREYNEGKQLYHAAYVVFRKDKNEQSEELIQLLKYCSILSKEKSYYDRVILLTKCKDLSFIEYRKFVKNYYMWVHKYMLEGFGYKFTGGLGTFTINRWKYHAKDKMIDYIATKAKRKEIIDKGLKLYNEVDKKAAESRGEKYDGVEYRVYREDPYYYGYELVNSRIGGRYSHHITIAKDKYKKTYVQCAESAKTVEDIYKLDRPVEAKLKILLLKYPEKYINYVRNSEYKNSYYRKHCREVRQ